MQNRKQPNQRKVKLVQPDADGLRLKEAKPAAEASAAASSVEVSSAEPGAGQLAPTGVDNPQSTPTSSPRVFQDGAPRDLSSIVGDPHMPEAKWMAACVAAGTKSLVRQPSPSKSVLTALATSTGASCAVLCMVLSFTCAIFLAGSLASFWAGINMDTFLRAMSGGDYIGFALTIFAGATFWTFLLSSSKFVRNLVVGWFSLLLVAVCLGSHEWALSSGAFSGALCLIVMASTAVLGATCKQVLPHALHPARLAISQIKLLLIPALLTGWGLWLAATNTPDPQPFSGANMGNFIAFFGIFAFCVIGSGYSMVRASRSKSFSGAAFLATLFQAPLSAGLLIAAAIAALLTVSANGSGAGADNLALWLSNGTPKALSLLAAGLLALGLSAAGGMLGAAHNHLGKPRG